MPNAIWRLNAIEDKDSGRRVAIDDMLTPDSTVTTNTGEQTLVEALDDRLTNADPLVIFVESVSQMKALDTSEISPGQQISVRAYYTESEKAQLYPAGGGIFVWDADSTESVDDGIVFSADDTGTGRFKRVVGSSVTPEMWGAVADSGDDAAPAVQSAIQYLANLNALGGGEIVFSTGNYHFDSGAGFSNSRNITIRGASGKASRLFYRPDTGALFTLYDQCNDSTFESLELRVNDPNTNNDVSAINFTTTGEGVPVRPTIRGVDFDGFDVCVNLQAGGNLSMEDCYTSRTWTSAIRIGGKSDGTGVAYNVSENRIRNCRFSAHATGTQQGPQIEVLSAAALRLWWCDITGGTNNLRVEENISGSIPANVWCSNVIFGGLTTGHAVSIGAGTQNANFRDCVIEASGVHGFVILDGARNIDIDGGMIRNNEDNGVLIESVTESFSIKNARISGNNKSGNNMDEILVSNVSSGSVGFIGSNHIGKTWTAGGGTPRYGVNINSNNAGDIAVIGNAYSGYGSAAINVSGSMPGTVTQQANVDL